MEHAASRPPWYRQNGNLRWWLVALVIVITAAGVRLVKLNDDEVRTDEGNYAVRAIGWNDFMFSTTLGSGWVWHQQDEVLPAWTQLSFNDHPPLHFAAIWLSTHLFGINLFAVRLPSALYGVGAVLLVMLILRRWRQPQGALVAGAILALLPWHIFISRQAIQESGVIFWILAALLAAVYVGNDALPRRPRALGWAMLGATLGLGLLTKYSAAIVLAPLTVMAVQGRWWRHPEFWLAPLTVLILLSPVVYYNRRVYIERGHFDLQLSRLLKQDTRGDWPASNQGIWQGDWRQAGNFLQQQLVGLSWPAAVLLLWGIIAPRRRQNLPSGAVAASYGAAAIGAILALITLNDYGRGSILLPFYALAIGISAQTLRPFLLRTVAAVTVGVLVLAAFPTFASDTAVQYLVKTFPASPVGFANWEAWRAQNIPTSFAPVHYASLKSWLYGQIERTGNGEALVVYDDRIAWFPANWYFFRYGFYSQKTVFMNSGIFSFLSTQHVLDHLRGRNIRFIEVGQAAADSKNVLNEQTALTDKFFRTLRTSQRVNPVMVTGENGAEMLRVWDVYWDPAVAFPGG
ncbi:MAG: glycosyltransferase family 39 protein [Patescibacteria group bacterium]|nr:glycosyltransferase family 39 protein [Patescibacteria group bacterium]